MPGQSTETTNSSRGSKHWLSRGVLGIGLASLFSDWGHEAATAVLPGFLASLGAPAVALGVIEGVSDGLSSFAKLAGGFFADRPHLRKPIGITGYLATAVTTFAYAFAHSWPTVLVLRALGWMGRGGRGPSRDALLAGSVSLGQQGRAFGFERAMDTLGAVVGPFCAAALLGVIGARGVMRWTLVPGSIAAVVFALLAPVARQEGPWLHAVVLPFSQRLALLPRTYKYFLLGVFAHGVGDFAPTLLILRTSQILTPQLGKDRAVAAAVALYTFYNLVNAAATFPAGALSDRTGKRGPLALGYLIGAISFVGFILARQPSIAVLGILFALAGVHGAFQQSIEKAAASEMLSAQIRGSGFGVLAAVNGVGDFVSSIVVGTLWSNVSASAGFLYAAIFSAIGAATIYFVRGGPFPRPTAN